MRKIKAIYSDYPSNVDGDIQKWLSVSGAARGDNGDFVTYILYDPKKEGISLNS